MIRMFTDQAELDLMVEGRDLEPLKVSKILQKVAIVVEEAGTEAAAGTGAAGREAEEGNLVFRSLSSTKVFRADHPFYYGIWDKKNFLFSGQFVG